MKKGQYLSEVKIRENESLIDYVNEAVSMCRKENNTENTEIHQIVHVKESEFLILINFYK